MKDGMDEDLQEEKKRFMYLENAYVRIYVSKFTSNIYIYTHTHIYIYRMSITPLFTHAML
jgi:hypothetical protein